MSNNENTVELNRRRVLGGIATIGVASAALGAGTFAAFSDTETSSDNSISAGTLDLEMSPTDSGSVTSINVQAAVPGDANGYIVFSLTNSGSISGSAMDVSITNVEDTDGTPGDVQTESSDVDSEGNGGLSEVLEVGLHLEESEPTEGTGIHDGDYSPSGNTLVSDGTTLSTAESNGSHEPSSGTPDGTLESDNNETKYLVFEYLLPEGVDNSIQGDSVDFDIEVTLDQ